MNIDNSNKAKAGANSTMSMKDQQGSYTMDPSKANAPLSPEIREQMANDRKYLIIYSILGLVVFAAIVLAVIFIGNI